MNLISQMKSFKLKIAEEKIISSISIKYVKHKIYLQKLNYIFSNLNKTSMKN